MGGSCFLKTSTRHWFLQCIEMEMENRTPGSVAELKESRSAQVDESITEVDQASAHLLMSPDQERLLVRKIDKQYVLPCVESAHSCRSRLLTYGEC